MGVQRQEAFSENNEPAENACAEPGGVSCQKSNTLQIYRQDVVKDKLSGMVGIVMKVAGEVEEGGDRNDLQTNELRVLWMDNSESTQNFSDVEIVDRRFLHGDFVAAASDPIGQLGVVADVKMSVDLLAKDGSIIEGVPSKNLKRIGDFTVGDYVVLGPWLGRIVKFAVNVTVLLDRGVTSMVANADPMSLKPISKNIIEHGHFPYYPGQRVRAEPSSIFVKGRWRNIKRSNGTVTNVTVGSVDIHWITSTGGLNSSTAPEKKQSSKNLKLLSCFAHANWQFGEWCRLPSSALSSSVSIDKSRSKVEPNDSINIELDSNQTGSVCDSEEATFEESDGNKDDLDPAGALVGNDGSDRRNPSGESSSCGSSTSASKDPVHEPGALLIANTRTRVDVAWQDGTIEREIDSTRLIPIDNPGDHEFVSEQYVVEKTSDDGEDNCETRRVGVVRTVNSKERIARVRWIKPVVREEDPQEFDEEVVTVSVYELEGHPDRNYCYGDLVVRLSPVSFCSEASVGEFIEKSKPENSESGFKKEAKNQTGTSKTESASTGETGVEFSDLSWFGNITGLKNGDIEVTWADGIVSTVGPQEIYVVGRDDGAGSEISDAASWETVKDDEMEVPEDSREDIQRENSSNITSEGGENDFGRTPALFLLQAVVPEGSENVEASETMLSLRNEDAPASCDNDACSSKLFDMIKDPSDHNFIGANGQRNNQKWFKKVQQDWSMLQNNLPEEIYVRVYEDRMDLLRAVIVGPYGTPYQDGLFFFDFHLPPEYPDVPPSAYYHSGGWRINPNLYEEGKVCLSLLNTWRGRVNEVWDPKSSSILQVLVSLQGLVLNSRPYFNEAGYDKQTGTAEGEKNSLSYNENTFLLNCKTMMYLMRKPPKDFEELIKEHFRRRGHHILRACDAYMKGYLIGSLTRDASVNDNSSPNSTSEGFKLMLAKIVPKLFLSLSEVGADCEEFKHLKDLEQSK